MKSTVWLRTMLTRGRLFARGVRAQLKQERFVSHGESYSPGTPGWLIQREIRYGGYVTNVPKKKAGLGDPAKTGFLTGGDRMLSHGYAMVYSKYLARYAEGGHGLTFVEIGILRGSGLALWCDLFENARIIGLDIDLDHFKRNLADLKRRGAFKKNRPEVFEFDQFQDNTTYLQQVLRGAPVDIVIDDGCHSDEAILSTLRSFVPHLAEDFVYFIEDNRVVHNTIAELYPRLAIDSQDAMTVLSRR